VFSKAYQIARHFTVPIVISRRMVSGKCAATIAAGVIVNKEGWLVTAAHVLDELPALMAAEAATKALREQLGGANRQERRRAHKGQRLKPTDIDRWSVWVGGRGFPERVITVEVADIGLAKLAGFRSVPDAIYPIFKNPETGYDAGVSLCRLGFPFHEIEPTYNEQTQGFLLPPGATPLPLFPNEGLLTRFIDVVPYDDATGIALPAPPFPVRMFETSTAALPGQSGGPIFDARGVVWGIQSSTVSYELELNTDERQYYHVGVGVHVETILALFKEHGIEYQSE
jgi:hypothetical protein